MKKIKYIGLAAAAALSFSACQKFLEPKIDNRLTEEQLVSNPAYAEGLLLTAYKNLPNGYTFGTDVASDDAVTNNRSSSFLQMATGAWRSNFNPTESWADAYDNLYYINYFLELYEKVKWSADNPAIAEGHLKRLKGESHGLRAYYMFQILQAHGGEGADGRMLGFPIVTKSLTIADNLKLPRNTYAECAAQILSDLDVAIANLPAVYADKANDFVHNSTQGARWLNRMDGNSARALKARVAMYAASPAFSKGSNVTAEQAATIAGDLIKSLGGITALPADGGTFYLSDKFTEPEIIWGNSRFNSNNWEANNLPPSQFGRGQTNPTQELVDAFPMASGFPITDPSSGYIASDPYFGRDPRLAKYVIFDGATYKSPINTDTDSPQDGIDKLQSSTRTGYYLRKFMSEKANLTPGNTTQAPHAFVHLRRTELFLNFAEMANEAWGPDADPKGYGFTARSVITAIRKRAGLPAIDAYLTSLTSKEQLRELIRNERRLELCFEDHRFWDIRRWNLTDVMSKPVSAMVIDGTSTSFVVREAEKRSYAPHMIYGPVSLNEVLRSGVVQNKGW